jgi:hypothetical protein
MTVKQSVFDLIVAKPNLTEAEIAERLFGSAGYQQRVNPICRQLVREYWVERLGTGGPGDPFRYRRRRILRAA